MWVKASFGRWVTAGALLLFSALGCGAQVLARPGWAGSGVTTEPWWRRAVFYRIEPDLFQDSGASGRGDLKGIAKRLPYLTELGVDAIVLVKPSSADDFGELARAASQAHIRVLVEVASPTVGEARLWLNNGAAGLYVDTHDGELKASVRDLRHLADGFPGDRVVVVSGMGASAAQQGAELASAEAFTAGRATASVLRAELESNEGAGAAANPLLEVRGISPAGGQPAQGAILDRAIAAALLGSRGAVLFDAGRELGLRSVDGSNVAMQWTASNVTAKVAESVPTTKPQEEVYGTYTPYQPELHMLAPAMPRVSVSATPDLADTVSAEGFTRGTLPDATAVNGVLANVATENMQPNSLLNFYRHMIALHHGNFSLRNGAQTIVDRDGQGVVAWIRKAPEGARTAATVVVACNLSESPASISLTDDLRGVGVRGSGMRSLLTASATPLMTAAENALPAESTDEMVLPAYTIYVGELRGEMSDENAPVRRHRR